MGCGCAKRARRLAKALGYMKVDGGKWLDPNTGHTFNDVELEEHHAKVAASMVWNKLKGGVDQPA